MIVAAQLYIFSDLPDLKTRMPGILLCLDVGWVWYAGVDPIGLLRDHGDRIGVVHLRDFRGRASVPLGHGDMDIPVLVSEIRRLSGLRALVVEQNPGSSDPLGDMRESRRYLREMCGL